MTLSFPSSSSSNSQQSGSSNEGNSRTYHGSGINLSNSHHGQSTSSSSSSRGRLNLSGFNTFNTFNPLRNSRALRKGNSHSAKDATSSATSASTVSSTTSANSPNSAQVVPNFGFRSASSSMNIHMNHKVSLDLDLKNSEKEIQDRIDAIAPPPRTRMNLTTSASGFFPLTGFESSSLDPFNHHVHVQDEFFYCTPKLRSLRRNNHRTNRSPPVPSQNKEDLGKLTLVLDIDETLIHSRISPKSNIRKAKQDQLLEGETKSKARNVVECESFEITLSDGEIVKVLKRPGLDEFLKHVGERYEVMAYTAGLKQYAEPLLDWLDPERKIFKFRLYRDSCLFTNGYYVKDLHRVNRSLTRTVLVDNNLCCFLPQLSNGIPISSFYSDPHDDALNVLKGYLENLDCETDVRHVLTKSFNLVQSLGHTRDLVLG